MIIYNTTYCITDNAYDRFLSWLKQVHIPQMLDCGYFKEVRTSRVLLEEPQEGTSISVQLLTTSLNNIDAWKAKHGREFQCEIKRLFGEEVLYFSVSMEVID